MTDRIDARLRVAILGTRGIPARYGGFETFAEQLATRLSRRGHQVCVYGRSRYADSGSVAGVEVLRLPALYTKYLETVSHGFFSALHCAVRRPHVAMVCNAVNAAFLPLLTAAGVATVINVDGIEWQRRKWSIIGRGMHRLSEHLAVRLADTVIADARTIGSYYRTEHAAATTFIPYGGDLEPPLTTTALASLGLQAGGYDLCVCRFEPENNALEVVQARSLVHSSVPLVMVGGATYARSYESDVRRAAGPAVRFAGFRFGQDYRELLFNARIAIYAGEVGGTHPAILEALGAGLPLIYNATPENIEVVGDAGLAYDGSLEGLASAWQRLTDDAQLRAACGQAGRQRILERYRWEQVTDAYEDLFRTLARRQAAG